jgi:MFS family permease
LAHHRASNIEGTPKKGPGKLFYGWWIAVAGMFHNFWTSGTFYYGFGAFFNPIIDTFGWKYATTSVAFSIQQSETGAIAPFVGVFIDRFGPRRIMIVGCLITGAGFILLSRITSLWTFYGAVVILAIGMSLSSYLVITTAISNWFIRRRGRAMAIMTTGAGFGGTILPILMLLINYMGWRNALLCVGVATWAVGIPIALMMRRRPEEYGMVPDGKPLQAPPSSARKPGGLLRGKFALKESREADTEFTIMQALKNPSFWMLCLSMTFASFAMSGINVHLIPAQISFGFTRETAALTVTLLTLLSLGGRWAGGLLADFIDQRYILTIGYILQAAGLAVLAMTTAYWHIILFLILYCPGFGATIPTRLVIQARYFGRRSYGTLMGIITTITTVFAVPAPILTGWMYDVQHSYRIAFIILAAVCFAAAPVIFLTRKPKPPTALP